MADWKEKGVVPDSDDEDALDSQSTACDHEPPGEERKNGVPIIENDLETHDIGGKEETECSEQEDLENSNSATHPALDELSKQSLSAPVPTSDRKNSSKTHVEGHDRIPSSSPNPPKVFKVPKVFWELAEEDFPGKEERSIPKPGSGKSAVDEISRSYVQITSPTSSILTSLPASQVSLPPNAPLSHRGSTPLQGGTQAAISSANPIEENVHVPGTMTYEGRSLRQRNPIQLHPYIVEQEKYRQTLKARGIAPMRIALSQDESYRKSRQIASPELDSQEKDSQDATETGDSQPMDFDWDPLLSSSPMKPTENDAAASAEDNEHTATDNEEGDDEDEEFPDIDELLTTRLPLPHPNGPRRRIRSYLTKQKVQVVSRAQNERKGNLVRKGPSSSVFDVPASPPATSPFPTTSHGSASSRSHAMSRPLKESTQTISAQTSINTVKIADLPTPATSAAKPIPVLVDSDSEDEFAGEQRATSSDESIQIRKVSKKIRGVLPASHLRLDYQQMKPQASDRGRRDSFSVSPVRAETRRGVALPKAYGTLQSPLASTRPGFDFLSSDSGQDEEGNSEGGFIFEDSPSSPLDSLFSKSRLGFAEEDDRIDAMLPPRKRQSTSSKTRQRKRSRVGSSTLFQSINKPPTHQPKITEHLHRTQQSGSRSKSSKRANKSVFALGRQNDDRSGLPREPPPPRLSILDVVDVYRKVAQSAPQFIRIAARTSRSKVGQGRQSPSRKFIRLANREDTHDAQSILADWREGRIVPKTLDSLAPPSDQVSVRSLKEIANNRQTAFQPPILKLKQHLRISNTGGVGIRRKLAISRGKQRSMNAFVTRAQGTAQDPNIFPSQEHAISEGLRRGKPRYLPPAGRFAQLESSETRNTFQHSASAFRSTKKTLDALYRISRKQPVPQANLQLSRFLADEDVVRPSVGLRKIVSDAKPGVDVTSQRSSDIERNRSRRKKRLPQRLDAGAAVYRQPSDPLILELLVPVTERENRNIEGRKLLGLAKFGTPYPLHFDVFPLPPGVFFHENTFIGSGRLSKALGRAGDIYPRSIRSQISFVLAGKTFTWCQWNEDVSSEIGLCFDWLVDQLASQSSPASSPSTVDAAHVTSSVLEYVHHHLSFDSADDVKNFLCRMIEILQDAFSRLESAGDDFNRSEIRAWIEVTSTFMLILLELLRIARTRNEDSVAYQLEDLMKRSATRCVRDLLSQNLDRVRNLYDDLQYLSFREGGIKSNEYIVQGWVIVMKVLEAAQISRGSFWDVVNPQMVTTDMKDVSDARMMEKLWYSMFSLLPLCEFDEFGVVIEGRRQKVSFDNWSLPQQLLKRVFALYHADSRQPPGFNDYCRGIVGRCHYLMVEWGWWNCSGVIGTLFDFFGSHNLAHLRNEEAYASPRFLQELNTEPQLTLEAEDRCFHIFLKIVALAIRHFEQVGDGKSIRNLVARLLPNHNRQYPKEESIHQRDLASLRNHHDLLCTLYWAAPPQHRLSPTLIQELVVADNSHKEACLINLRAWEQLASFVLTHDNKQETYQPLKLWYRDFFSKLVEQYLRVESEIRDQARALQGTNEQAPQEQQLQEVIMTNRETLKVTLCTFVKGIACRIEGAQYPTGWMNAFETLPWEKALALLKVDTHSKSSHALLHACVEVINSYIDQVDGRALLTQDEDGVSPMTDEAVAFLEKSLLLPFRALVNHYLDATLPLSVHNNIYFADELYEELIACWARFVALVTDKWEQNGCSDSLIYHGFVGNGPNAVFRNRSTNGSEARYWPYFLTKLLEYKKTDVVELYRLNRTFNFEVEWLLILSGFKPSFESEFTHQLQKRGFSLSAEVSRKWAPSQKLRGAIRKMGRDMQEMTKEMTYKSAQQKAMYNFLLVAVMKNMQKHLEAMDPPTGPNYEIYLKIVQAVAAKIKRHGTDICQLSRFFLVASRHYRPPEGDPEFYTQGILNYSSHFGLRLKQTSFELFYYLLGGWKKALVSGEAKMHEHRKHIKRAMKEMDFMLFLLNDFVPAIIQTGFRHLWSRANMMYVAYLPRLADKIGDYLNGDKVLAQPIFEKVMNLLRIIMNCLLARYEHTVQLRFPFPKAEERTVRSMACLFWLEVTPHLENYVRRVNKEESLQELNQPYLHYLERMDDRLDPPHECKQDWMIPLWPVEEGKCRAGFEKALEDDIRDNILIEGSRGAITIGREAHWVELSSYDEWIPTFEHVLQYGRIGRHATIPGVKNTEIMNPEFIF